MTQFFGTSQGGHTTIPIALPTTIISHWKLDGDGVDAEGVSNLTLSGTPETPVDPLLADGGTSLGFDGTDDFGEATHAPAYAVDAATIALYCQPDSIPASGQRGIMGKGTLIDGELQIEQRRNPSGQSMLRVYLATGSGGSTVNFANDASDGIVELTVDVGHLVVVTVGPNGMEVYHRPAGGSVSLVGTNAVTAGLTTNNENWVVGRSPYATAEFDGVIDNVQVYQGQFSQEQVELLEAPVTITHGGAAPTGEELTVPSLAEWLTSDEADPSVTKYVSNQDRGNGSGSSPANAQEVQAALNGASAGDVLLAVAQTPGTVEFWDYPSGLTFPNGSSGNPITLQARQGDGVVISRGEDFAGARTPSSGFWTQSGLSQADIDKQIWRSSSTFSGGDEHIIGWWIEFDHPQQIIRAINMTNLRNPFNSNDSPPNSNGYAGPCVHKPSDNRVYLRMQRNHPDKYSADNKWSATTWAGHPEAVSNGQIAYPISQDPNVYEIYLCRATTARAFNVGSWAKIGAGINSMGFRFTFSNGSNNIQVDRGLHYAWHSFIEDSRSSGNEVSEYFFNRTRSTDGAKIHASRAEWKFDGWQEGIRSSCFRMFNSNTMSGIYCKDCTFADWHELMTGANNLRQIRYRNCAFFQIYDDGIQANFNMGELEFGYCYFLNAAYGGMGKTGTEGDPTVPAQWYMHHCIIDVRQERNTNWRGQPHPMFPYLPHSPDGRNPHKTYNNLIIFGPDQEEEMGPYLHHCPHGTDNTLTGAANMHEVFNNILLRVFLEGTKRYDAISSLGVAYSDNNQDRSDFVNGRRWIRYSANFSNEVFDYNLYWRPAGMSVDGLLREYARGSNNTVNNYATLAAWRSSGEFEHSKLSGSERGVYTDGFDGNSTEAKPNIPTIDNYPADRFLYRPAATAAVTTSSSGSLSGTDWWTTPPSWGGTYFPWNDGVFTLAPDAWKGALDPNGDTLPVGVQDP